MNFVYDTFIFSFVITSLSIFMVAFIKHKYKIFCQKEEQKERISILLKKIHSSREYVRKTYSTPFDTSIYMNIIPKIDFIEKLIMHKDINEQEKELNFLLDMITETFIRLRDNFCDIQSIVSPLNNLRDRLVQEHIQFLKDHTDETLLNI